MSALRQATHALHSALDEHSPLSAGELDIATYARHAQRVLGWMAPLEAGLYGHQVPTAWRSALDADTRAVKAAWLQRDLHDSGLPANAATCPYLPTPRSLAEAFGASYVCEGATLGGAYLYKQWRERLQPLNLHWLQGYGEHTGVLWRQWQQALALHVTREADIQAAAQAAVATFDAFKRWVVDAPAEAHA